MNEILQIFRALADSSRLRIMLLIMEMELSVGELAVILDQSQPRVSRHVRILAEAGLIERSKEGSWVFLRLSDAPDMDILGRLLRSKQIASTTEITADRNRLAEVREARSEMADRYFESHAAEWDAIRSLHIAESDVEVAMRKALTGKPLGRLVDIGTGTGRMVEIFGNEAQHVKALDKSPAMLRLARAKIKNDIQPRVELILGDFNALPVEPSSVDTVIMHQVLHYAQHPELVISEAARILGDGGRILIADFAKHDREELRTRDAHARLGFSDDNIQRWFASHGLKLKRVDALDGGELTVKIWLGEKSNLARLKPAAPINSKFEEQHQ